ncbi:xanthine dehydrogenase family protein molybdopterin-binding subunit [Rhabdothermincola salaria]|uniref:xanthine dehydrogenase family protein molybdopterin-binding subunit n=1 Tax=Rhabdothermincola salaria TaxID=2903142 RepID=UPI001E323C1B|nr:xanthine dehydrogenase family protein molybdopterin-binding subunit [Rhabdothermincola salaria]MCD9623483.1 xanthine dehydrogenase family protein molybdopterin-binding subunit [Rhabdothermincola salaria]
MSVMGTRVARREDPVFLTTGGVYTADLDEPLLEGALHAQFVRSTIAHARLVEVDASEAREAPGVVAVYTAADIAAAGDLAPFPVPIPGMIPDGLARPWLATDVVRFVGEAVAVVIAETKEAAEDAAELVIVDVDPLETLVDPLAAATDELLLFPEHGTNTALGVDFGTTDDLFDGCEVVVRRDLVNQRVAVCPLEPRAVATTWHDGRLVAYVSTQAPHGARNKLAGMYGLEPEQVHVIAPAVGGGFGAKINLQADEALLPWISRRLGRPIRWAETRSESMVSMPHGRGQHHSIEIGGRRDGTVEAYRLSVVQDAGAYPGMGAFLPFMTRTMAPGVYDIAKVECNVKSVVTNTTPVEAYRGAGRPEATAAVERAIDLFAAEIGMDPADVRRRNLIAADAFPFTTPTGAEYDVGDYAGALDRILDAADYAGLRAEQKGRRERGDRVQMGIGVSIYVEITAGPAGTQGEYAKVHVRPDGSVVVHTGTSAHGQGHSTSWAMLVHDATGVDMDRIEVVAGDTDRVAEGTGTFGSRSLQLGGTAVWKATEIVVDKAREVAADLLEAAVADVVLDVDRGVFHVAGTPSVTRSWADVGAAGDLTAPMGEGPTGQPLEAALTHTADKATFPFGAHLAVVEVDTETGEVTLDRIVACDDAGRMLNPLIVEGQRHGGIAQGVAQALYEAVLYDDDGNPQTANLADYAFVSAAELPSFELVPMETPTPVNPLGAKGIGESGTIGSTPAVQSAVIDALSPYGVEHLDMPLDAERVWRAIRDGGA